MEIIKLAEDINLFCIKADSFPEGIKEAQDKLLAVSNAGSKRNYFGISYLYDDKILYMAAAELVNRQDKFPPGSESYTLRKGSYISIYIADFAKDIPAIGKAFKQLLDYPGIDENGCCAECYLPEGNSFSNAKDVRCMVRLAD